MPSKIDFSISNFEINNILDQHVEGDLCSFNISFQDTPNVQNFYKLKVWAANTHQEKHKSCTYTVNDPSFFIPLMHPQRAIITTVKMAILLMSYLMEKQKHYLLMLKNLLEPMNSFIYS